MMSRLEAGKVLRALGVAVMGTFCEFEKQVQGDTTKSVQGGDIHPLTGYVMDYRKTLNQLLETHEKVDCRKTLKQLLEIDEDEMLDKNGHGDGVDNGDMSPIGRRLLLVTSSLEKNLEEKSRMYEDRHLGFIFLMNNVTYMVQKVKDSEKLRKVLGDNWIRSRRRLTNKYAESYFRGCWTEALFFLKPIDSGTSNKALKDIVKYRFNNFNYCFEDIYRTQTGWKIQDDEMMGCVRTLISGSVAPAYRRFLSRYWSQLEASRHPEKYLKYSIEQLERYLLDLFEGVPLHT